MDSNNAAQTMLNFNTSNNNAQDI